LVNLGTLCAMLLSKSKEIDRLHLKFLKRLLNVNQTTCKFAFVYGELGRYPLYVNIYVRITKYWLRVRSSENIVLTFITLTCFRNTSVLTVR